MAATSSAPHQMQVRVTFYTSHNPQSVLMILKNDQALEQITEKARELFNSADYRLFYGDVNGPIYEFTDSEQVMSKIRITTFSRTPQLFVRLESGSTCSSSTKKSSKGDRESKSSAALKRIEQNQELTLKSIEKLQNEMERVSVLQTLAELNSVEPKKAPVAAEKVNRPFPPVKHSASCDACLGDIVGHRYKCLECADYDLCEKCEKNSVHYEHAMVRLVHPNKTKIPAYIINNCPNNVFPSYMQRQSLPFLPGAQMRASDTNVWKGASRTTRNGTPVEPPVLPTQVPAQAPTSNPAPVTGPEARFFNDETCAALINSASILKDTFSTLSKSFMDLADGAQANMEKKIIERSTMEAGVKKVEEKVDNLKRHCEEKCFGSNAPDAEKSEDSSKKSSESSVGPKIKKAKKKTVYKRTSEKLVATSLAAAAEEQAKSREEAKKRADASTADLQRKLAVLNLKPLPKDDVVTLPIPFPPSPAPSSLETLMRAILSAPRTDVVQPVATPTDPNPLAPLKVAFTPAVRAPIPFEPVVPTAPIVETLIVPPLPAVVPKPEEVVHQPTAPLSIHSSFENISSDFESLSPSWQYQEMELPQQQENVEDDLLDFSDVVETPEENIPEPSQPSSVPSYDSQTEKTFDRLLEMGFDYNVVVNAVQTNGSDLEKCLLDLLK